MYETYEMDDYGTPLRIKRGKIAAQEREYGENWEQSEELKNFIFDSDELPSRKFMRGRKNGQR